MEQFQGDRWDGQAPGVPGDGLDTGALAQFAKTRGIAKRRYSEFVMEGIGSKSLWNGLKAKSVLGEREFLEEISGLMEEDDELPAIPRYQKQIARLSLEELAGKGDLGGEMGSGRGNGVRPCIMHGFIPSNATVTLSGADQAIATPFDGTILTYCITGRVTDNGVPVAGGFPGTQYLIQRKTGIIEGGN